MDSFSVTYFLSLIGLYLVFQCIHVIMQEERTPSAFFVVGKILVVAAVLIKFPEIFLCPLGFLSFYPKNRQKRFSNFGNVWQIVCVIILVSICVIRMQTTISMGKMCAVLAILVFLVAVECIFTKLLERNQALVSQMQQTAVGELKVKCLNEKLSIQSHVAERNARLEERENIARNIHNVVGHTITAALISLQAYEVLKESQPEAAEDKLNATSERMHLALEEIRRVVRVMDEETEEITISDFCSLLGTELNKFSMDTEIKIIHNLNEISETIGHELLEKRTNEFLHSCLAECLNNGIRHGGATEFSVFLQADPSYIKFSVSDNGTGFQQLSDKEQQTRMESGFGLRKMYEYVLANAGTMQIESDTGFCIRIMLPKV